MYYHSLRVHVLIQYIYIYILALKDSLCSYIGPKYMLYGHMDPYTLNPYRALTVALKGPLKGLLGFPYRILNMSHKNGTTMEPMGVLPL